MAKEGPPRSISKYVIIGAIGAVALVGVLIALSYTRQPPPQTMQDNLNTAPSGDATEGAGKDNPGPTDGGGVPDTNPNPVPDATPTAAISASPNPAVPGSKINVEGSGFDGDQRITLAIGGNAIETEPEEVMTDDAGNLSAEFTLPEGQEGELEVTATDASGNMASTILTVK